MVEKYVKNPVTVHAVQWIGDNQREVRELAGNDSFDNTGASVPSGSLWVAANMKWLPIEVGEWVIRDELGCYPCKNIMFEKLYVKESEAGGQNLIYVLNTVKKALEGDSNDAEHNALVEVADHFNVIYVSGGYVDLDHYVPGNDVDEDDRVIEELTTFREAAGR
jgi:hypothetical protein